MVGFAIGRIPTCAVDDDAVVECDFEDAACAVVLAGIVEGELGGAVADNLLRLLGGAASYFISRKPTIMLPQLRERNGVGQYFFGVARTAVVDGVGRCGGALIGQYRTAVADGVSGCGGALVGQHGADNLGTVGNGQARCTAGHDLHGAEHEAEQSEGAHVAGAGCEITA